MNFIDKIKNRKNICSSLTMMAMQNCKKFYDKPAHLALGTGETTMKLEAAYIF